MPLDYNVDCTLEDKVQTMTKHLLSLEKSHEWKTIIENELEKQEYTADQFTGTKSDVQGMLYSIMEKKGVVKMIKRDTCDLHREANQRLETVAAQKQNEEGIPTDMSEHQSALAKAVAMSREAWEVITRDEMMNFANEMQRPLYGRATNISATTVPDTIKDDEQVAEAKTEKSAASNKNKSSLKAARFLYDCNDLLHALQEIKSPTSGPENNSWGSIQVPVSCPAISELRRRLVELDPHSGQFGLDEVFATDRYAFLAEKERVGAVVLTHRSACMARQYLKSGSPGGLRPKMWEQALGLTVSSEQAVYHQKLLEDVRNWSYLTDDMYLLDLQQTKNTSDYFIFEEHLHATVMAFTRDTYVRQNAPRINGAVNVPAISKEGTAPSTAHVPPNGVLPFSGLSMYVAPLAYVYSDEVEMYSVFREMYVRYWSKLNAISAANSMILYQCKLFEELTTRFSASTVFHLLNIGVRPLDIAFKWIQSGFSSVLEVQQVLMLWDRVIGYDSVDIIAIFAAAFFRFRGEVLESMTKADDVKTLSSDTIDIQVVPLLQEYLFLLT